MGPQQLWLLEYRPHGTGRFDLEHFAELALRSKWRNVDGGSRGIRRGKFVAESQPYARSP